MRWIPEIRATLSKAELLRALESMRQNLHEVSQLKAGTGINLHKAGGATLIQAVGGGTGSTYDGPWKLSVVGGDPDKVSVENEHAVVGPDFWNLAVSDYEFSTDDFTEAGLTLWVYVRITAVESGGTLEVGTAGAITTILADNADPDIAFPLGTVTSNGDNDGLSSGSLWQAHYGLIHFHGRVS